MHFCPYKFILFHFDYFEIYQTSRLDDIILFSLFENLIFSAASAGGFNF